MNNRQLFLQHVAQTSPEPMGLEMVKAEGIYQTDIHGKKYVDLIAGTSVSNVGHSHPAVVKAVQQQAADYMHLQVYGEYIESPQVQYAKLLCDYLPERLNSVYFTNSGAEAVEGALKLAKRYTGRSKIYAFKNSYHGSTQGALSTMGSEYFRSAFRPLLPQVYHFEYNGEEILETIDEDTACVLMETVQAEAGVLKPDKDWIKRIRKRCTETGTLLILDEIQAGLGRTGTLWAFQQYDIVPDILLLAKALGGGMPLGAFIADIRVMNSLTFDPVLGHISTFAGHPVCCAAGKAAMDVLLEGHYINEVQSKELILKSKLIHPAIKKLNTAGLWGCVRLDSFEMNKRVIDCCIRNGLLTDWFLFVPEGLRICPPLTVTETQLAEACDIIVKSIEEVVHE